MWQDLVMVAVVGVAGGYLAWPMWRRIAGTSTRCACGAGGKCCRPGSAGAGQSTDPLHLPVVTLQATGERKPRR